MTQYRLTDPPPAIATAEGFKDALKNWSIKTRNDEEYPVEVLFPVALPQRSKEEANRFDAEAGCKRFLSSIEAHWSGIGVRPLSGNRVVVTAILSKQEQEDTLLKLREAIGREPTEGHVAARQANGGDPQQR